ncbi:unnamed protein product [Brachionus calyciflorus]|uniref:SWIM-type domain-containing protein n=1 Tax=Brachionus calyciflorus TaxID=104777 RepID=A0A813PC96_9BILA|nr:unnamed protein product [Brachionus calyciflorus]
MWLVNKNRVELEIDLKVYLVQDERDICFQVKLIPKPSCNCVEKTSCCHILAVEAINGINIEKIYKIPNLSKLTKSKNLGSTGRKNRVHLLNSHNPDFIEKPKESYQEYELFLRDLVDERF